MCCHMPTKCEHLPDAVSFFLDVQVLKQPHRIMSGSLLVEARPACPTAVALPLCNATYFSTSKLQANTLKEVLLDLQQSQLTLHVR